MFFLILISVALSYTAVIQEFTPKSLKEAQRYSDVIGVTFYSPTCIHCVRFRSEFQQIANSFEQFPRILFGKVNCREFSTFCQANKVTGYPSYYLFLSDKEMGVPYLYKRTAPDIVSFTAFAADVTTMVAPPIDLITAIPANEFSIPSDDLDTIQVVMLWRQEDDNSHVVKILQKAARIYSVVPTMKFHYLLYSDDLIPSIRHISFPSFPSIVVFYRGESFVVPYRDIIVPITDDDDDDDDDASIDDASIDVSIDAAASIDTDSSADAAAASADAADASAAAAAADASIATSTSATDVQSTSVQSTSVLDEEDLIRVINDISGTSYSITGAKSIKTGHIRSIETVLKSLIDFSPTSLEQIQLEIDSVKDDSDVDVAFVEIYQKTLNMLKENGSQTVWKEWLQIYRVLESVDEDEEQELMIEYMHILRSFVKGFDLPVMDSDEL